MSEWICLNSAHRALTALAANVTVYKWLLAICIVLAAVLGLVFFAMMAVVVLRKDMQGTAEQEPPLADAAEESLPEGGDAADPAETAAGQPDREDATVPASGAQEESAP